VDRRSADDACSADVPWVWAWAVDDEGLFGRRYLLEDILPSSLVTATTLHMTHVTLPISLTQRWSIGLKGFLRATAVPAGTAEARISYGNPQLYRQVLLRRVLAMGILSVRLSVCHDPVVYQAQMRQRLLVFTI